VRCNNLAPGAIYPVGLDDQPLVNSNKILNTQREHLT
jgi:hypothetical protein